MVFSNLELKRQGHGIIMAVTRLLLLGPFYSIQTNFLYFFAHDCMKVLTPLCQFCYYILDLAAIEYKWSSSL